MKPVLVIRHIVDDALEVVGRIWNGGFRSGKVCARTHIINLGLVLRRRFGGRARVECPCCGWRGVGFRAIDCVSFVKTQCVCPNCLAFERQRLLHVYLTRQRCNLLQQRGRILHFAPETHLSRLIAAAPGLQYMATDIASEKLFAVAGPRFRSDIARMPLADASIDALICVHVLEHLADDRQAVREMYRILKPGGWALIMVPLDMELPATVERGAPNPLLFDHVRDYSIHDFRERLAPFRFEEVRPESILSFEELDRYKVPLNEVLYRCAKPRAERACDRDYSRQT